MMSRPVPNPMKIAVACSGLGHVHRGIEAWAEDLATALRHAGVDVKLFGAGDGERLHKLPCLRRSSTAATRVAHIFRHLGGWRYGFGSVYDVEQTTFALALFLHIWHDVDILHIQDPIIAAHFELAYRLGITRTKVIYANGTGENEPRMRRFTYLQLLTEVADRAWQKKRPPNQTVFMIPNFIDTSRFLPGGRQEARAALGLPRDATIVLCCAAIRRFHKRIDYLLTEFANAVSQVRQSPTMLVIAGAREADTDELHAQAATLLGDRVRFFIDVPRSRMPEVYRASNLFVLPSLHEMFGIVLLEAMAVGLPVICHDSPEFRRIVGTAGYYHDLSKQGALSAALTELLPVSSQTCFVSQARSHVERRFSANVVLPSILTMYRSVIG